ncbi:MAG: hypothetical protein WC916_07365 [Candidatus Woesearchaeota archaeon]
MVDIIKPNSVSFTSGINLENFTKANISIAKSLASVSDLIPDISASIIPVETFSQFEKIFELNALISKQISIPKSFFTQFEQIERVNSQISHSLQIPDKFFQQMQSAAEMSKKLTDAFQIPESTLRVLENLQKINYDRISLANDALKRIAEINTSFLSSLNPAFNIGFSWEGISGLISKSLKFEDEDEFETFEYNWAGCLTIHELKELYDLWKNGEKDKVRDFFYQWFSDKRKIDNLIENFRENDILRPRMPILEKAFQSHLDSDYELSIPVLISQIDGIFIEKHKDLDGQISFTHTCKICGGESKTKSYLTANNISKFLLKKQNRYMPFFLEHIIDTFDNLRNDILHGKKLDYANKDLSTKLVLTLVELNFNK